MDTYEFDTKNPRNLKRTRASEEDDKGHAVSEWNSKKMKTSFNKNDIDVVGYSSDSSIDSNSDDDDSLRNNPSNTDISDDNKHTKNSNVMDTIQFNKQNIEETEENIENLSTDDANNDSTGITIEAFDIKEETENGVFDVNGNYIEFVKDEKDSQYQDNWIDDSSVSKNIVDVKKVQALRKLQKLKERHKKKRTYILEDALQRLKFFIPNDYNILQTLSELNLKQKKNKNTKLENYITNVIKFVTDIIQLLENKGIEDIYELNRSKINDLIEQECLDKNSIIDDYKSKIWCFKWLTKSDEIHEVYTSYEMQYWKETYFKNAYVIVRLHDEKDEDENWYLIDCIKFM